MTLTVGMLGPFEVRVNGRPVGVTAGRLRSLLGVLAMSAGRPVPIERLVAAVWGDDLLPGNARRVVQTYIARLRATIGADHIGTAGAGGYLLSVGPDDVDALRFLRLLDDAAADPDPVRRHGRTVEALALWRGTPFEDLQSPLLHESEAPRLLERYLSGLESRIDLDLAAGRSEELVAELAGLTARHPLREPLWARRIRALRSSGRHAEALACYEQVRVLIADELGVDPGAELQELYADLLAGRDTAGPVPVPEAVAETVPVPRQLPPDVASFTGRDVHLKDLDAMLHGPSGGGLAVLHGSPGVGKTSLAVHWAYRSIDEFPDGQLFLNLYGHSTTPAMAPTEALGRLLRGLGVAAEKIPLDLDEQIALYRTRLAGRRVLIVLDNAASAEQVRPLVPGEPRCVTLVTSRNQQPALVALHGARHLMLDVLDPAESRVLLTTLLGDPTRVADSPGPGTGTGAGPVVGPAAALAELCGHLPLALSIAGAYLSVRPHLPLTEYAARLRTGNRLAALSLADDPQAAIRSTFDLSYRALPDPLRVMFRVLGLHPGVDLAAGAAAALAGTTPAEAERLLDGLADANLLQRTPQNRYACHDLLRLYAEETAAGGADADAATARLFDHYVGTAGAAVELAYPGRHRLVHSGPVDPAHVARFTDAADALRWLDAERANLVGVAERAVERGRPEVAWVLADCLSRYLRYHDHAYEWRQLVHCGLDAARHAGDVAATAAMLQSLGTLYGTRGRDEPAIAHFAEALPLFREVGDRVGECRTCITLGIVLTGACRFDEARGHLIRAWELSLELDDPTLTTSALGTLGVACRRMGRLDEALDRLTEVLRIDRATGDRRGESVTLENLGTVHLDRGDLDTAVELMRRSVDLVRRFGERVNLGFALNSLAIGYLQTGRVREARELAHESLALSQATGIVKTESHALSLLGDCQRADGRLDEAAAYADRALALARDAADAYGQIEAHLSLAATRLEQHRAEAARHNARQAERIAGDNGLRVLHGRALTALAAGALACGDPDDAVRHCGRALALHRETGCRPGEAEALRVMAQASQWAG